MNSGITIKQLRSDLPGEAAAQFELWHQEGDQILTETVKVHVRHQQGAACSIEISGCNAPTVDEALDKMAGWLSRMSEALKERPKPLVHMPIY